MPCPSGFGNCNCGQTGEWTFQIKWRFPAGGGSDAVDLFDLVNAIGAAVSKPKDFVEAFNGHYYFASGVNLTRQIAYPFYIAKVTIKKEPLVGPYVVNLPDGTPIDYATAAGPLWDFGPVNAPEPQNSFMWPLTRTSGLPRGGVPDGEENVPLEATFDPLRNIDAQPYVWGGMLRSPLVTDPATANLFGDAQGARAQLIPPGTVVTLVGYVQRYPFA